MVSNRGRGSQTAAREFRTENLSRVANFRKTRLKRPAPILMRGEPARHRSRPREHTHGRTPHQALPGTVGRRSAPRRATPCLPSQSEFRPARIRRGDPHLVALPHQPPMDLPSRLVAPMSTARTTNRVFAANLSLAFPEGAWGFSPGPSVMAFNSSSFRNALCYARPTTQPFRASFTGGYLA
jgi:hypothetical protein